MVIALGKVDYSPAVALRFAVSSPQAFANGVLIYSPISPDAMLRLSPVEKNNLLRAWLDVARKESAEVVGLGAYSSVISRGGELIQEETQDLTLTTGNSLTAITATEMILDNAHNDLIGQRVVVIGARGAVGQLIVSELAHHGDTLELLGRPGTESALHQELVEHLCRLAISTQHPYQKGSLIDQIRQINDARAPQDAPITTQVIQTLSSLSVSNNSDNSLSRADFVVTATSEGKPFLHSDQLKAGAIAIDVARPFDFIASERAQAEVLEGGLMHQPNLCVYGDSNLSGTEPGVNLACLSETLVLALNQSSGQFSIGKSLNYEQAKDLQTMAQRHGFHPLLSSHGTQPHSSGRPD